MKKTKWDVKKVEQELRDFAMAYPEAHEDFPWGERAIKVKAKAFLFMRADEEAGLVSLSCKLPQSRDMAAELPFAEPTHYGLGKHGWVTAKLTAKEADAVELMKAWIDESFRAVAPKKLVATLPAPG